jgi:molybdopterin synthase sulfur carrier subunit
MNVTINLYAVLREGRFESAKRTLPERTTIADIMSALNLSRRTGIVVLLNAKLAEEDVELKEGDVLSFFPLVGGG